MKEIASLRDSITSYSANNNQIHILERELQTYKTRVN